MRCTCFSKTINSPWFLGALILAPGIGFAVSNSLIDSEDAQPVLEAVGAVFASGAVGLAVASKPSRTTALVALGWSVFSVLFEANAVRTHLDNGSRGPAMISSGLGAVRFCGVLLSGRLARRLN